MTGTRELDEPAARHWSFPRSVAGLSLLLDFAGEHGVPRTQVLRGVGVPPETVSDPSALVRAADELTALRNLAQALAGRPAWGLELGQRYHVTSFGILGYALLSSRTVLDAMNLALRFLDLSYIFATPSASLEDGQVCIELDAADLPVDLARSLVERDVAAIHTVLTELVPGGVPFSSVDLGFPTPTAPRPYADVLGVAPRFGSAATVLRFDVGHLDTVLGQPNPHSRALAEAMCRDVVARRRGRSGSPRTSTGVGPGVGPGITEEVRLWIAGNIGHRADMPGAAAALSMSERTLRRRLSQAGTGFQALLDEVRQALAEEMLTTDVLGVEDVALRLGYAEASSFIHAFKRWVGVTPAQFQLSAGRRAGRGSAG